MLEIDDDKCFNFQVTNLESGRRLNFRAEGVNFDKSFEFFDDLNFTMDRDGVLDVVYMGTPCGSPFFFKAFLISLKNSHILCVP